MLKNFLNKLELNFNRKSKNGSSIANSGNNNQLTQIGTINNTYFAENKINSEILRIQEEIAYNIKPGVGNKLCPFKLTTHEELLIHEQLDEPIKAKLREITHAAKQCNANEGEKNLKIKPGQVKELEKKLLNMLMQANVI